MNKLISIIIPLYNSEKYIARCIESIINQSFKDFEIIVVDDNSSDNSYKIVCSYINKSNNIKCLKNSIQQGPSYCRNFGLENSKSKYVMFLDSDDWLDLNCLSYAIEKFESDNLIDIVIWEIKTALHDSKICTRYKYIYNNTLTSEMALSLLTHTFRNEYFLSPLLGCKLFKTSLLEKNKLRFIDTFYEDDIFTFLALNSATKIGIVTGCNLYYYQHPQSLTHNFSDKHIYDLFTSFNFLYNKIKKGDLNEKKYFYMYLQKCITSLLQRLDDCVSDIDEIGRYKSLLLTSFTKQINTEEFFNFCSSLTL